MGLGIWKKASCVAAQQELKELINAPASAGLDPSVRAEIREELRQELRQEIVKEIMMTSYKSSHISNSASI